MSFQNIAGLIWTARCEAATVNIEKQVKLSYPVQNILDSTGDKNIKIFQGGQPNLEITNSGVVSALKSTVTMWFQAVLDRCGFLSVLSLGVLA